MLTVAAAHFVRRDEIDGDYSVRSEREKKHPAVRKVLHMFRGLNERKEETTGNAIK
jgi:hypothetical protein